MIKDILFHGVLKGIVVYVITNAIYLFAFLLAFLFAPEAKKNIVLIIVTVPIVTIIVSAIYNDHLTFKKGIQISISWFFIFIVLDYFFKIKNYGFDNIFFTQYTSIIYLSILVTPVLAALSSKHYDSMEKLKDIFKWHV